MVSCPNYIPDISNSSIVFVFGDMLTEIWKKNFKILGAFASNDQFAFNRNVTKIRKIRILPTGKFSAPIFRKRVVFFRMFEFFFQLVVKAMATEMFCYRERSVDGIAYILSFTVKSNTY
jgi:hypothetical protein